MFANAYFAIPVGAMESGGGGGTGTGDAMLQEPLDLPPNVTPEVTYTSLINEPTARRVKRFKSNNAYISVENSISDGCCAVTFNPGTLLTTSQIVPGSSGKALSADNATTATTATTATLATTATTAANATNLGGFPAADYAKIASMVTPSSNPLYAGFAVNAITANNALNSDSLGGTIAAEYALKTDLGTAGSITAGTPPSYAANANNSQQLGSVAANLYALKTELSTITPAASPNQNKAAVAVLAETATLATTATSATTATTASNLGAYPAAEYVRTVNLPPSSAVVEGTPAGYAANATNSLRLGGVFAINYRWSTGPVVESYSTTTPVSAEKDIGAVVVLTNASTSSFTIRNFAVDGVGDTLYTDGYKQRQTDGVGSEMTIINKGTTNVQLTPSGTLTVTLTSRGGALKLMPNGAAYCVQISPTEIYISGALIP